MLSNIRKFSKTIFAKVLLVIVIIPFVFWGMGGVFNSGNTNSLAKINNVNISTEDLVYVLRNMGYETDVNLPQLIDVAAWVEGYFDDPLPGQVMKAGLFPDDVIARQAAASAQA